MAQSTCRSSARQRAMGQQGLAALLLLALLGSPGASCSEQLQNHERALK